MSLESESGSYGSKLPGAECYHQNQCGLAASQWSRWLGEEPQTEGQYDRRLDAGVGSL